MYIDCVSCRKTSCAVMDLKCSSCVAIVILSSLSKLLKTWIRETLLLAVTKQNSEKRVFLRLLYCVYSYTGLQRKLLHIREKFILTPILVITPSPGWWWWGHLDALILSKIRAKQNFSHASLYKYLTDYTLPAPQINKKITNFFWEVVAVKKCHLYFEVSSAGGVFVGKLNDRSAIELPLCSVGIAVSPTWSQFMD